MAGWPSEDATSYGGLSEQDQLAEFVRNTAMDFAKGSAKSGQPTEVSATPENRRFLAPLIYPKGSAEPELAIPDILYAPYASFEKLYGLLKEGASPTDEDVVRHSTDVAAGILGTGAGGKAAGKIAKKGTEEAITYKSRLFQDENGDWIASGWRPNDKGGKPERIEINWGDEKANALDYKSWLDVQTENANKTGKKATASVTEMAREGKYSVHQNTDGDWILKGPGIIDHFDGIYDSTVHQTINFKDNFEALQQHLDSMSGQGEPANIMLSGGKKSAEVYPIDKPWPEGHASSQTVKSAVEMGPSVTSYERYAAMIPHQYLQVSVNGVPSKTAVNWAGVVGENFQKNPEVLHVISDAYHAGVGAVEFGGGEGTPNIHIKFSQPKSLPTSAAPLQGKYRPENAPTELEMSRWPDAIRIDTIMIDEAHPGPIIAYHGTTKNFINFDLSKSQDIGVHFGTREQATKRIGGTEENFAQTDTRIIPAYLNVKKPLELPDLGGWYPSHLADAILGNAEGLKPSQEKALTEIQYNSGDRAEAYDKMRDILNKAGYDSIRYLNTVEGQGWSYIVWNKGKVKSATNPDKTLFIRGPGPLPPNRYEEDNGRP